MFFLIYNGLYIIIAFKIQKLNENLFFMWREKRRRGENIWREKNKRKNFSPLVCER